MTNRAHILPEMTWPEAKEALALAELALIPVGSFEQHGPHGTFEVDTGRAYGFGKLLAARMYPQVVLSPVVNIGVSYHHLNFPGTITLRPETFMAVVYVVTALVIIALNYEKVPAAFAAIFAGAFGLKQLGGGALGYGVAQAMRFGIARGLFSNESGLGSAAIAHAPARTKEPVREGMVAMLGPFIDTIVICTMTALIIIMSGLYHGTGLDSAALSAAAFGHELPRFGPLVVKFGLVFFAFSTIIGWSYYGDRSVYFLFGARGVQAYRWLYVALIPLGAAMKVGLIWGLSDIANGLMAFPNLVALIGLSGLVAKMLRDYERRLPRMKAKGKNQLPFFGRW